MTQDPLLQAPSRRSTFVRLAAASGLGFGLLFGVMLSLQTGFPAGMYVGLGAGVVFGWIFGAIMTERFRVIRAIFDLDEAPDGFEETLEPSLADAGYALAETRGDVQIFKPGWRAGLMAGRIVVRIRGGSVVLVGPGVFVVPLVPSSVRDELDW